jgi:hypothetical protein
VIKRFSKPDGLASMAASFIKQSELAKGAREEGAGHHCGIRYEAKTIARQIALQRVN